VRLVHAFPTNGRMSPWSWCWKVHRDDVKLYAGGYAGKLLRRVSCPDCHARLRAMLAV